jgi:ribonucleoside-diphosphate reductase alpha chain
MCDRLTLPDRRASWTQSASVGGQRMYLTCGEKADGSLGEIWIVAAKAGTFVRGVLEALARTVSMALQCGVPLTNVVSSLRLLNFPPNGPVAGSPAVVNCTSVADWIASEIEAVYLTKTKAVSEPPTEGKAAGYVAEDWRSGA